VNDNRLFIHASNVTGLGASQVVGSLVDAILRLNQVKKMNVALVLPDQGSLSKFRTEDPCSCVHVKRWLPNSASRLIECLFPQWYYETVDRALILGDIPLRGVKNQVVLVHQPNLIKPSISAHSSVALNFRIMRSLFGWNLKYVQCVIVQSDIMKQQLISSYPALCGRIEVVPQPAPEWFRNVETDQKKAHNGLNLFYPAAGYPHKNHRLIAKLTGTETFKRLNISFLLTLHQNEFDRYAFAEKNIRNLGRLTTNECLQTYAQVDALFFPSLAESYGLPLVEAMLVGLPIVCIDLPYARWMCENEAIYFSLEDDDSVYAALIELQSRLASGWKPDWREALKKLPKSWNDVAQKFMDHLL